MEQLLRRLATLSYWLGLSFGLSLFGQAQSVSPRFGAYVEVGSFAVNGPKMPFWLRTNQAGVVPLGGSAVTLRMRIGSGYRPSITRDSLARPRRWDWGYGVEMVGNTGPTIRYLLPQAYGKIRCGHVELAAGRWRSIAGLVDTLLTSGSYSWSGNALPLPKVQLGTIGFVPLGFTKGFVAIQASFAHGWFNATQKTFVQHSYLHQKSVHIRLGKPTTRVRLYAGINHLVQWGGYANQLPVGLSVNGNLPTSIAAYKYVVGALRRPGLTNDPNLSSFDAENRIGNHLGSVDLGTDWTIGRYNLLIYRQSLIETGSLYYLTNIADGLNGIRLRNMRLGRGLLTLDHALVEFFYSESQGGPNFVGNDPYNRGKVDYFNHSQYRDGWLYYGHTIGTPFLSPRKDVRADLPVGRSISNNRVSLWHLGLGGRLGSRVQWQTKVSYSRNLGSYDIPYPLNTNQLSALLTAATQFRLPGAGACTLTTSLAVDRGTLFDNTTGLYIGLRKVLGAAL